MLGRRVAEFQKAAAANNKALATEMAVVAADAAAAAGKAFVIGRWAAWVHKCEAGLGGMELFE